MYSTITDNTAALASDLCINSLFTVVAAQYGNNVAINFENVSKYVDLLADELNYHISHGQLVAVLLPRSPAQVIAILAILKLGAIYVPINPELPKARIGSLISSVPIEIAICLAETEHQLPHKVLPLTLSGKYGHESRLKFPSSHRDTKNWLRITTDDLATILFTSGSTGQPKAVKLTHKNLIPQAKFLARELGLDSSRSVFQFSSCSFDVHLLDILSALLSGAQLHQASQSAILSDLEGQIMSFNSDTIQLTPTVISTLQPHNVPSIRCMVTCGEACTEEIVNTWGNRIVLLNIYGPCEAPTTSIKRLRPGTSPSCVGKPPSYANIAVVNERGQSLPSGHVGEVLAYGETVSQGYFNGEAQEKFTRTVQFTTGAAPSSGWYATGDFGLIDEAGELHLRGRADDQIKISGQRIELGDIHQVIYGIPGCGRCVVLAHTVNHRAGLYAVVSTDPGFGQPGNKIVIADGYGNLRKEIFASCRANLPAYMVPQVIIVKSLPRNVNGKVDVSQIRTFLSSRHTLDEMRLDKSEQLSEYGHQVASIIRKRLQQLVPSKDDLLEWGFNSMDAVWVIKELHEKTGHRVSITELLSHPTIESIANQIESVSVVRTSHASEPTPMPRDWYVASPGQHSLFRATKVFGNKVYTCKIAYEIAGSLDPSRFLDCLTEKYAQHAIFNTSFVEDETGFKEGNIVARVKPDTYNRPRVSLFPFEQSRRAHFSATSTGVSLLEAVYDWEMSQETDLDIEEGPVASAALYQTDKDANQWLVILTFHHMVIDEYSSNTFWSELIDLYQAKNPTAMITPTKRIDYSQYATIYRAILESRGTSDGDWWRDVFRGYRPQPLFQDAIGNHSERLSGYDVAADIYWKTLPQREATRLTARRGNAANTFGAWLSLAQLFLSRVTGKTEYLLGVPTSARAVDPRFVSVMGYCMTLAVLPVSLDLDQDSLVFEAATLEKYRQCVAHDQRVEDILSWLAEENQTENTANVDALFVYHDPLDSSLDLGNSGLRYKKLADATGGSHYHLILHLDNSGPSIRVGFEYRTESFSTKFIEALAQAFTELAVELSCSDEQRSVGEIVSTAPSQALQFAVEASTRQAGPRLNDELMQSLVIAWTEILPIDETQVDIHRSFFKTGGDSVSAIRFCARARKLGIRGCTVAKMRSNPSLSQLHDVLAYDNSSLLSNMPSSDDEPTDEASGLTPPSSMPSTPTSSGSSFVKLPGATDFTTLKIAAAGINESEVDVVYPPTAMQSSMVQQSLLDSNSGVYHSQLILHLEGPVQEMKLRKAWSAVCNANPSLRTIFVPLERGHVPGVAYLAVELKQNARIPLFESRQLPLPSSEMFEDLLDHDRKVGIGAITNIHKMTLVERGPCEYTLIFTCHHAVFDGWSTTTLLKQLGEAYSGTLPLKTSRSNAEYFTQQLTRDRGASEDLWRQYLAGVQLPQLPQREHVMERPSHKRIEAALQTAILSSEFQARAEAFGVTPFTIVQLAFALALERSWIDHRRSTRVGFWTVTSGRSQKVDDINAIGNFLNTIPCVVALSSTTSVHKSLQATYRMFTKMSEHDCVSTTDILRCFEKPECDIDALLVFENHPDASEPQLHFGSNIRLNSVDGREVSSLPFVVVVEPGQTEVKIIAKFDEARHHSGSVRRVLDRFSTILSNIVSHPTLDECSLSSISCDYHHSEKQLVLQQGVNLSQQSGLQETLVSLFRQCVAKHGQRKALATHSSWLTFAELDDLTDRLAIYLSRQDNSNSKIVPIVLEKSPWMVIAMLAVLKSGRAYCPLEFDAPSHRISFAIKRLGAGLIITNENGFPKLASLSAWGHPQILVIDNIQTLLANAETRTSRDAVSLLPTLHPDMACYVMFTSGSTSSPKACTLTHGAVASAVQAVQPLYNFEPSSRILLFANYVFDASAIDIWGSLSSGSCLFLLHDDELKSDLIGHIDRLQINWIHLTPTVLRTISPDQVPSLKTIILGGEMMVPDLLNIWAKQVEIVAAYGPTEAAIQVLTFRPSRYPIDEVTYTALPGNLVVVVNERREICHINEPGEIVIAGKQLFVGYEGNILATQAALTTIHGFGEFKFYKTGDRAYYSHIGEDGKPHIRILGRVDHQMKVSGMRIAPEEIEQVLNADPDVVCSAVVASYGRSLDALVVGRDNNLNVNRLMTLCRERLPERLRPVIHQVKEIPLLASRKVDRKRLSTLLDNVIASKPGGRSSSLVSQNDSAKISAVTAIIENVLGTKVLDVNAPLANLGLDSLGFMRLKHSLCTKFHLPDLTYRQLRNIATAAGIADLVGMDQSSAVSSDYDVVSIAADKENVSPTRVLDEKSTKTLIRRTGRFLALPSQLAMWVAQERLQDTTYNVQRVWRFEDVTADSLLSGLLDVVHRLEMFRTTFEFDLSAGKLYQVVHDESLVAVQISRISHVDIDDLRASFIPHNCATIDLRNGPLAIFHLIADGKTVVLHSTIHHIIVDEFTSIQLFNLIRCASRGSSDLCAFEGTSSIALHAAQTANRHDENHLNEWKQRMSGAIGIDTESHYEDSYNQLKYALSLPTVEGGKDNVSFVHLLSCFHAILHRYTQSDDVTTIIPISSRGMLPPHLCRNVLGNLTHTAFLRSRLGSEDSLEDFTKQIREGVDFALESDMAINKVASACGLDTANFMIQFIMHDAQSYDDMSSDMTDMTLDLITSEKPMFDLMWHVFAHKDCLDVLVEFNEQKYAKDDIKILVQAWEKVIDKSNCQGGQSISSILFTIIPEDSLFKKTDSNTKLTKQACELQVPPPSDLTSSQEHRATSTPIDISVDTLVQKDVPQSKYDEARARFESLIRESLCKSLGIASIDGQSSLRELGLDSFSCMAFMADMIRHEPDISVSMRDVMSCPTMESLVEHFADRALSETSDNKSDDGSYVALGKDMLQRPQHGLASSMQKRFYLLQEQLGDSTYSLPSAYRVHGVHSSRVIAALQDIVTEHDIFRTHFDFTDESELLQIVDESERLEYTIHDLSNHSDVTAAEEVTRISHEECMREFNLAEGHLVRCTAIILPNGEQYIIINFHHCVADERTITGVWEELCSAVTDKSCSKETANFDAGSYIDFSTRHHEMLKSNKLAEAQTFFQNLLVGPENSHGLFLRQGPETESYPDAITINRGTIFDYDPVQWAYKSGSTPFAAYLFTFQLLLSFKSGTEGSSVLIPATCRGPREQNLYGCFINTLPVRFTKLAGTYSMTETLRDFQDCLAKILEYSDIPFERLLESIGWGANDFDTIFTYHNVPAGAREKARTIEPCKGILPEVLPGISAKFPLAFTITREMTKDGKSKLDMSVEFNPDRISEVEVLEICKEYECLLLATNGTTGESESHKDTSVTQRDSRSELQPVSKVPSWFHGMPNPIVETTPFADVQILDQAKARPSATAMIFENEISITYKEMVDMISGLASYLSTRIGPQNMLNQAICIVGDASIERIITILAIMTAGGAYVPIELNNPIDWNLTIIADCEPAAVVFIPEKEPLRVEQASQLRAQLKAKGILCVDINTPLPMASEPFKLTTKRLPEHLAYVLYTSGSTGKPKGVAIQNHALRNATVSLRPLYRLAPNKRLLQLAPWTFDVSVIDIFGTLTVGATLCIGRKSWMLDDLQDTMAMLRITHIATTPTIAGALDANALPDVECLDIGGEPMTELCRDVWASKATLFNIYGPTEATVDVLGRQCFPDTDISNIGRPLENVFVYVLDDKLRQVGIGEVGQLAIGGHQLARGYLKPPAGAAAFVDTKDYGRIYLTGDCARFEPDGSIVCLGRMDTMVNLRGLRVELGAIESAVNNALDQGKSVVIMIKRPSGDCLVAIFTDASLQTKGSLKPLSLAGLRPLIQKLQASVKDKLPAYFMPSLWVPLNDIPMNNNGKLDRKMIKSLIGELSEEALDGYLPQSSTNEKLDKLDDLRRFASSSTVAQVPTERPLITTPAPTTETRIQGAFKEILGDRQFPMDASFFSMGGDSISVIRLRSVLTKAGFTLKVKDIYQNPTITALADFLDPSRSTRNSTDNGSMLQSFVQSLPKTESQMVSNLVPPTPIIDWFFASQRANENWFNQGHIIKLNKKHTYEDFQRAWSNIVEAHPMLRLVVSKSATHEHGKFIGIPNESTNHTYFLRKRLSSMEELPEELSKLQSCLNLSSGRICAVGGFHIGDELYCAIFAHHLAVDVVSWQVIWSDLEDLLQGDSIEPEFSSFPEWAEYLLKKRQLAGQIPARIHAREYSSFLTTEQMKRLSENTEASGSFMNVKVDVSTLDLRREDTEPVDMMLASLVLALSTWQRLRPPTNQVELHFESHGRDLELEDLDLTRTVGWFTRIIPIAFNVPLQGSVNDFTTMVQQTRKHAMSSVNLASAIETAPVDGMVTFNYLGQRARTSSYTSFENVEMDLGMYQSPTNQRFSILDIECSLTHEGQLDIGVFYSTAIHTAKEIRQLLDSWSYCIRSVADGSQSLKAPIDHTTYSIPECMQDQKDAIEESIVAWKLNTQDIEKMAPATDGQAAMLLTSLGSRSYMHSYNYEATDTNTDIQRLQHAWDVALGRHSIFRTIFMPLSPQATYSEKSHHSDIQLVQVILKATELPTPLVQTGKKLKPMQPGFAKQLCRLHIHKSPSTQKVRSVYNGQALAPQITQFSDIVVSRYEKARQDPRSNDFWQSQMRDIEPSILVNPLRADQVPTEMQKAIHDTLIDRHQQFCFPVSPKHFRDAAHYNHTTIPILFHAAWALTLSTYLSTRDVVLGSVVSGRRGEDIERIQNVVGPCLNTVPLRVCVDWNQTMCQFIEHVTDIFLDMAEHEDLLSLKQIQGLSGKKTLFNSTLITNTPLKSENIVQSGFHLTLKDMDEVTDVPVLLNMSCEDSTIVVDARVHGEDIDEEQLCRMMGTLGIVLQHVADARRDTTRPLQSMDLLETNHHRVIDDLVSGPRFPIEYDGLTCSQLLQSRVSRYPDQSAVELYRKKGQKPVVMTYKALSTIVELGAKRLRAGANLEPKSRVAIFMDKSTELICAIHAIHRADCAYVALDIDNPQARTKLLLEQISPSAIICSKDTLKLLPQTFLGNDKCPFIVAEQLFSPVTQSSNDSYYLPPSTATSDDVAAILFTSGTTGTPKAVIMPHRQVVGYGIMMAEAIGYGSDDRVFNFARLVFDVSQSDIFGAIYSGATLVLAPQTETVSRLPALLRESGTTSLNTTPSIASLLYPDSLPHIRSLCLAGEMATKAVYERWTPFVRVINAYGPTEAVVISWKHATASIDPRCIGRPSIGIQIHILDDHMRRVPMGSIGTIWCSGRQLSDGYYGRPEETTKAFRENPYGPGLIYNTGDLGAYDSNGEIVYHARKDRQIKVNGRRLELSEIERTLTTRNHSVVVLLLDSNLVAFCCKLESSNDGLTGPDGTAGCGLNDNMAQTLASMEAQAHQMLPSFMIPKCFVPVSAIPLTGNSKVDQLKLHEVYKQWKTQRSVPVHDATALTLRPTVQAPEKSTYEQQVPPQQHGRSQDIDWSLREDDWSDYLLPYFNPKAPLGTQPRGQIFAFFAITGTSKQHSILAPYLPSFNLIGVENIFFHQPDYYSSLQAMAVEHSALIRRQQPTGPYLLAGFSFAGQLAYEVANELRHLGEDDVRVVLIDSAARERAPTRPGGVTDADCEKFFKVPTTLEATAAGPEVVDYRQGLLNQIRHNITLHNEYVPRPFDGNALIIPRLPNQGEAWDDDETNGYAEFVPQARLQVRTVTAADHFAVMEEEQSLRKIGHFIEEFMAGF
ncbi:hypothetical protein N5P37_011397 [Trichoderma harzianum]|nr:hypothetical protein N5P37_011397 [Trichoderma harzianum]